MSKLKKRYTVHFKAKGAVRCFSFRAIDDTAAVAETKRLREQNMDAHLIMLRRGSWIGSSVRRVFCDDRADKRFILSRCLYPEHLWGYPNFERGAIPHGRVLQLLSE